jgi:hypothetical protein
MKTKFLSKAAVLLAVAASLSSAQAAPLTVASDKVVMLVSETVTASGVVSTTARTGPLTTAGDVFSIDRLGTPSTIVPISIPAVNTSGVFGTATGLPTAGRVTSIANTHMRAHFPSIKNSLSSHLRQYGITSGWFNFKQEVDVDANGQAETWAIYWDFFVDATGRGGFPDARLVPPDPKILYVVYTPLRVDADLPQSWSYPEAGTLKYQLRNLKFEQLTDWTTLDTGGAYDSPQTADENVNAGLGCLMDSSNAGCTVGPTDVAKLLDSTGAAMGVVDYVRRVEPELIEQADGSYLPKMSTTIEKREVTYSGCADATFHNTGSFGYTLQTSIGRYMAIPSGTPLVTYQQIQEFSGSSLSPTQAYDYTVPVTRSEISALSTYGIDPVKGGSLVALTDIPGLISAADVEKLNSPQTFVGEVTGAQWWYGDMEDKYQVRWILKCTANGDGYEITTRVDHQRYDWGWDMNQEKTSPVSSSGWSPVALDGFNNSRYLAYADLANRVVRLAEGTTSDTYPYYSVVDEGYDAPFVCAHNSYSMQRPWNINYACENKNQFTYDCGPALHPADWYIDGEFQGRIETKTCTGSTQLRGIYMDSGQPYWENVAVSVQDRTKDAVEYCDGAGNCTWEIHETNQLCVKKPWLCEDTGPYQLER